MSHEWVNDIAEMHSKYGVNLWVKRKIAEGDFDSLKKFLEFRISFLEEELTETRNAVQSNDPEEIVDGLIDLCVVAIGTLDAFDIDAHKAWNEVHQANMSKEVGVKASRPNKLGLPDLIKKSDWIPPSHANNHGILNRVMSIEKNIKNK